MLQELRDGDGKLSLQHAREPRRRGVRLHRALRHRDLALVRREAGRLPAADHVAPTRRSPTSRTARTRTSAPPTTRRSARACTCSRRSASAAARSCRSTTCSTSTPARLLVQRVRGPGVRDHQAQQPVRGARSAAPALEAYRRAFACDPLSAFGGVICFNRPVDAELAEALTGQFAEVVLAPGFNDDAVDILAAKPNLRDPRGQRAPARQHRRVGPQARDRRPARPGPRPRPRGPLGDGGRDRAQAVRARVGRDAVRLEGLQARPLERDRARPRPRVGRDRRGPDEPRRLGPPGDREGRATDPT